VPRVALRGGGRVNTVDAARMTGSIGASVALKGGLWIDGQVTAGERAAGRGWGVGLRFGY
jgi:hypothetical protein